MQDGGEKYKQTSKAKNANLCSSKFWAPFAAWAFQFNLAKILQLYNSKMFFYKIIDKLHQRTHIPKSKEML